MIPSMIINPVSETLTVNKHQSNFMAINHQKPDPFWSLSNYNHETSLTPWASASNIDGLQALR